MLTKSEKTKLFIIEKSAELFNKKGYAGTSMSDIMQATGLAKGGIYGNFEGKDEIAGLAFDFAHEKVLRELSVCIQQNKSSLDRLFAILDFYKDYTISPTVEGGCPILNLGVEADDSLPFLKKKVKVALQNMLNSLERILHSGINKDEFKTEIDVKGEAEHIFAQIEGAILMAKLMDDPMLLNRALDRLKSYIMQNVKK